MLAISSLLSAILSEIYSSTHEGYHKTLQRGRSVFYWVGMRKKIKEFIRQCDICQRQKSKSVAPAGLLHPLPIPSQELFRLQGISFNFNSAYHPQTDGQTKVVNKVIQMYLKCFTNHRPKEWVKWIPWAEFYYNTNIHSSTKKTLYEVVYSKTPPTLLTYVLGTTQVEAIDHVLKSQDEVIK